MLARSLRPFSLSEVEGHARRRLHVDYAPCERKL